MPDLALFALEYLALALAGCVLAVCGLRGLVGEGEGR